MLECDNNNKKSSESETDDGDISEKEDLCKPQKVCFLQ